MEVTSRTMREELAFGSFSVDAERIELKKNGRICRIQPQPLRILVYLVERPGKLVTRDELRRAVWGPGVAIDAEHGLNFAINQIRTVLGDSARHPRYIETVPRRGYRFVATVDRAAPVEPLPRSGGASAALPAQRARAKRFLPLSAMLALLVLAAIALAISTVRGPRQPARDPVVRVAVLPFEPLVHPEVDQAIASSFTADLIGRFARRAPERLAVIGRRSIQQFSGGDSSIAEAGKRLNVAWIVDGTVTVEDGRIRVQVSLVNGSDESVRWSRIFDRELGDLAWIAEQITSAVATALEVRNLAPVERAGASLPVAAAAYRLFADGRFFERSREPDAWERAAAAYRASTELAPNFAPAFAALALLQTQASFGDDSSRLAEARTAGRRALVLDPSLPAAQFVAAILSFHADRDLDAARRHFRRALELSPGDAHILSWYAGFQAVDGEADASATSAELALKLDPLAPEAWVDAGYADYLSGRLQAARHRFQRALELGTLGPKATAGYIVNAWQVEGDLESAAVAAGRALDLNGPSANPLVKPPWGPGAAAAERVTAYREQRLARLRAHQGTGLHYLIAVELAGLDRRQEAVAALQSAYDHNDLFLPFLAADPMLTALHADDRVRDLLATMGLSD